jgi:putative membrane protein
MIVTSRISIVKLLTFTCANLFTLMVFVVLAMVALNFLPNELLRALSYATGFLGTALAFLIGFRNNNAYSRWWEAQRSWSKLKYESRSFALAILSLIPGSEKDAQHVLIRRQIAFAWRLNRYLRKLPMGAELDKLISVTEKGTADLSKNPPYTLLAHQNELIRQLFERGVIDSYKHVQFSEYMHSFNEILGSCERLKKTPFPMQYSWFMTYTLAVFLLVLPLSLAGHMGYWSVPLSLIIGYAFVMLEYVGRHIENPFENTVNDVPMDYISRAIEIDLLQLLGETDLPPVIEPVGKGYLY